MPPEFEFRGDADKISLSDNCETHKILIVRTQRGKVEGDILYLGWDYSQPEPQQTWESLCNKNPALEARGFSSRAQQATVPAMLCSRLAAVFVQSGL